MVNRSSLFTYRYLLNKLSVFLILLISIGFTLKAQNKPVEAPSFPMDDDNKLITYKKVDDETGNKDELYERGMLWFKKFFKYSSDVIREKDKENGRIKGIARFQVFGQDKDLKIPKGTIEFTIILEFKDGRYRYTITNFNVKHLSYFPLERWLNKKDPEYTDKNNPYLVQIDEYVNKLLDSLEKEMVPKEKKPDNW